VYNLYIYCINVIIITLLPLMIVSLSLTRPLHLITFYIDFHFSREYQFLIKEGGMCVDCNVIIDSSRKIISSSRRYQAVPFKFSTLTNRMVSRGLLRGSYCIEMAPATLWKLYNYLNEGSHQQRQQLLRIILHDAISSHLQKVGTEKPRKSKSNSEASNSV